MTPSSRACKVASHGQFYHKPDGFQASLAKRPNRHKGAHEGSRFPVQAPMPRVQAAGQNSARVCRYVLSVFFDADGDPSIVENDAELYEREARLAILGHWRSRRPRRFMTRSVEPQRKWPVSLDRHQITNTRPMGCFDSFRCPAIAPCCNSTNRDLCWIWTRF